MDGYQRSVGTTWQLVMALMDALIANPEQRFGQLLMNLTSEMDADIWEIYDEEWITMLKVSELLHGPSMHIPHREET
jgi:hypothetical protein